MCPASGPGTQSIVRIRLAPILVGSSAGRLSDNGTAVKDASMTARARRPLPSEIAVVLKAEMRDGVHPPGGRLPTEADLCRRVGGSRGPPGGAPKEVGGLRPGATPPRGGGLLAPRP